MPRVLSFQDPKGTTIELFAQWSYLGHNHQVAGVGPYKLGHLAFFVPDPKAIAEFYERVLGFRVSDWVEDFFVFLRCNADHHTVNFIRSPKTTMHHIAFELRDWAHIQNACDLLGQKQIPDRLGSVAARTRPQCRGLPPRSGRSARRVLRRARPDEGRGARLFRAAALASRPAAAAQGLGPRRVLALGTAADAGFPARAGIAGPLAPLSLQGFIGAIP